MNEECRISEYDGSYKCWAHDKCWGAIKDCDPCLSTLQQDIKSLCAQLIEIRTQQKEDYDRSERLAKQVADAEAAIKAVREHKDFKPDTGLDNLFGNGVAWGMGIVASCTDEFWEKYHKEEL